MIVLGIALAVIGFLLLFAFAASRINCRTATEAVVIRVKEKKRFYRGRTVYARTPVFSYAVNGKAYAAKTDRSYSDPKRFAVGQKITVYVDARHPEKVRYGSNMGFCITGILLTLTGIFLIVLVCI